MTPSTQDARATGLVDGDGWVFWNPDSGEEYAPNHPVKSGECVEAERVRRSTAQEDTLWRAFQDQFLRAEALSVAVAASTKDMNHDG